MIKIYLKSFSYNEWWKGRYCLIYCPTSLYRWDEDRLWKVKVINTKVDWASIDRESEKKIKEKQKELFWHQEKKLLDTWINSFSANYNKSERKKDYLDDEIKDTHDILFNIKKNGSKMLHLRNHELTFEINSLPQVRKYVRHVITKGEERNYNFIHSPNYPYQNREKTPPEVYAQTCWDYYSWLKKFKTEIKPKSILVNKKTKSEQKNLKGSKPFKHLASDINDKLPNKNLNSDIKYSYKDWVEGIFYLKMTSSFISDESEVENDINDFGGAIYKNVPHIDYREIDIHELNKIIVKQDELFKELANMFLVEMKWIFTKRYNSSLNGLVCFEKEKKDIEEIIASNADFLSVAKSIEIRTPFLIRVIDGNTYKRFRYYIDQVMIGGLSPVGDIPCSPQFYNRIASKPNRYLQNDIGNLDNCLSKKMPDVVAHTFWEYRNWLNELQEKHKPGQFKFVKTTSLIEPFIDLSPIGHSQTLQTIGNIINKTDLDLLRKVKPAIIDNDNQFLLGSKKKGAVVAFAEVVLGAKTKKITRQQIAAELNEKIKGLNMHPDGRSLTSEDVLRSASFNEYKRKFITLLNS